MIQGKLKPLHMLLYGIYLLIDDFVVWSRGGKSFFGNAWQSVIDIFEKLGNFLDNDLGKITALAEALSFLTTGKGVVGNVIKWALNSMQVTAGVVNVKGASGSGVSGGSDSSSGGGWFSNLIANFINASKWAIIGKISYDFLNAKATGDAEDDDYMKQAAASVGFDLDLSGKDLNKSWSAFTGQYWYDNASGQWRPNSEDPFLAGGNAYPTYASGSGGGGAGDKTVTANTTVNISVQGSNAMSIAQQVSQSVASVIAQNVQGALA